MEKTDFIMFGTIILLYVYLIAIDAFIPQHKGIAGILGLVVILGQLVLMDYYMIYKTAPFAYLRAICRPSNEKLHIYIKRIDTKQVTNPDGYASTIELAFPIKHPSFGKISKLVIRHRKPWEKRVIYSHGRAVFQGYTISHPNVAEIVLHEKAHGSFDVDRASPIPSFVLHEAPGDYYLPEVSLRE